MIRKNKNYKSNKVSKRSRNGDTTAALMKPVMYRPLPSSYKVALTFPEVQSYVAIVGPRTWTYGLREFLGDIPQYTTQLYGIYKYARIHSTQVDLQIVNNGTNPVTIAMATMPDIDIVPASTSPAVLIKRTRSIYRIVAGNSAQNRASLSKTYHAEQELGQPVLDKEHWVDAAQAVSTTNRNSQDPVVAVSILPSDQGFLTSYSVLVVCKVTFHVEFFSPELA